MNNINLNRISLQELIDIEKIISNNYSISIENYADINILNKVNSILNKLDLPVSLVLDGYSESKDDVNFVTSINIIKHISNVKKIYIRAINDAEVSDINDFCEIKTLVECGLRSNFKKGMVLTPLEKYHKLEKFEFDNGFNKKQQEILPKFSKLKELITSNLSLSFSCTLPCLETIRIYEDIKEIDLIAEKFPYIKNVYFEKCKSITDLSPITKLSSIKSIWLRYMKHISVITKFKTPESVTLFQMTNIPKLKKIDPIFDLNNLEGLMLTELEDLKVEDFNKLSNLKNLKVVFITLKNRKENERMEKFITSHGWNYIQPGLVGLE